MSARTATCPHCAATVGVYVQIGSIKAIRPHDLDGEVCPGSRQGVRMVAPRFRILRQLRNGRRVEVDHPQMRGCILPPLHAPDAATAIKNAKTLGITGELIAVPESN